MLSIYHSLLPSEIRLLRLLPSGDKSATLKAQLFNLSFLESGETVHPYYALSYVWGGNDKPRSLSISGHNLPITESLYEALSRLRHSSIERILWVDAVCINQDDEREKEQQIRIMANVYAQASCVVVWLGPEADDSDKALEAIRAAANPLGQNSTHPEDAIVAVRKLLQGPWFRRIWVLQEVASAHQVAVKCGNTELNGLIFALGIMTKKTQWANAKLESSVFCVTDLMRRSSCRPDHTTHGSGTNRSSFNIGPLAELIDMYHSHDATQCHDKLYALLGMCSDDPETAGLAPSYQTPWHEVLSRLVKFILGDEVSVRTWDHQERADIRDKGWVLGRLTVAASDADAQHINIQNYDYIPEDDQIRYYDVLELDLPITATPVQDGDILFFFHGASKPTIIRACGHSFAVVAITVSSYSQAKSNKWEGYLRERKLYTRDLSLTWDWKTPSEGLQSLGKVEDPVNMRDNNPGTPKKGATAADLDESTILWNSALVLESVGERAVSETFVQRALQGYTTALGLEPGWIPKELCLSQVSWASGNGHAELVEILLSQGADVNFMEEDGRTPLFFAAEGGHMAVVRLLLARGAKTDPGNPRSTRTPLSYAAQRGHCAIADFLLARGAELDPGDRNNRTPLSYAAEGGHDAVVQLLLTKGANANLDALRDVFVFEESTPLDFAAKSGHETVVKLLLANGADVNDADWSPSLISASTQGHIAVVRLLLANGAMADNRYLSPLRYAAENGQEAVVQLLLANGADVNLEDDRMRTALWYAARAGHLAVVQLLIAHGAKTNITEWHVYYVSSRTPLSFAAQRGDDPMVRLLLANGAVVDHEERQGETALWYAVSGGHHTVVRTLLANGATIYPDKYRGSRPTYVVAEQRRHIILQFLKAVEET